MTSAPSAERRIAVYCSSSTAIEQRYLDLAFDLGVAIADAGWELVWGGGKISMMGKVAEGARSRGGRCLGVIPTKLKNLEFADSDATELIEVADMRERKGKMESLSDAFIALPGSLGTLEELLEIWVGGYLKFHSKPVVILDPFDTYRSLKLLLDDLGAEQLMKPGQREVVHWSSAVTDSIAHLRERI
jgi:uncharacterized protein (TIGR00730 family)